MGIVLHLISLFACLQTVIPYPIQTDEGSAMGNYGMRLEKRPFYPYRNAIMSPFGLFERPRGNPAQRKKAVDSTFIRFGRSSTGETVDRSERSISNHPILMDDSFESPDDSNVAPPQRFLLDHKGCRVAHGKELLQALLNDPNCIRVFQKAKKENVNDTFIRFGKREAPPEKEFEPIDSIESR